MSLLFSAKGGYADLRLKGLAKGLLWAWVLPSLVAGVALLLQNLLSTQTWGDGALMLWAGSYLLLISPALSWLGLVIVAPFVAALMERGWFGWITALGLGILIGAGIGYLIGVDLAISFGAAQMLILRAILGRSCPQAFRIGAQG
jgi:hypothetical protein